MIQEASMFFHEMKLDEGNKQELGKLLVGIKDSCRNESDYELLMRSDIVEQILDMYRKGDDIGVIVLSELVGKIVVLPKNNARACGTKILDENHVEIG